MQSDFKTPSCFCPSFPTMLYCSHSKRRSRRSNLSFLLRTIRSETYLLLKVQHRPPSGLPPNLFSFRVPVCQMLYTTPSPERIPSLLSVVIPSFPTSLKFFNPLSGGGARSFFHCPHFHFILPFLIVVVAEEPSVRAALLLFFSADSWYTEANSDTAEVSSYVYPTPQAGPAFPRGRPADRHGPGPLPGCRPEHRL